MSQLSNLLRKKRTYAFILITVIFTTLFVVLNPIFLSTVQLLNERLDLLHNHILKVRQSILYSQTKIETSFDDLNKNISYFSKFKNSLQRGEFSTLSQKSDQHLASVTLLLNGIEKLEVEIDHYKSRWSILRNSIRNYPEFIKKTGRSDLYPIVQDYMFAPDEKKSKLLMSKIRKIDGDDFNRVMLRRHLENIVEQRLWLKFFIDDYLGSEPIQRIQVATAYFKDVEARSNHNSQVVQFVILLSLLYFTVFILVSLIKQRELQQSIEDKNRGLEALNDEVSLKNNELTKLNDSILRFVPGEFTHLLGEDSIAKVTLGQSRRLPLSILFSDIRDFTSLSEQLDSEEEIFNLINSYLSFVAPAINDNKGFIDKYIGDAIMALFHTSPNDALNAAIIMLKKLKEFNLANKLERPVDIGIGLHHGDVMLGIIGEKNHMESTVIADAVNLASRIESITKRYRVQLLISDVFFSQLKNREKYHIRFIDKVLVKGVSKAVAVYEVFNHLSTEERSQRKAVEPLLVRLNQQLGAKDYSAGFKTMEEARNISPDDPVIEFHINRLNQLAISASVV